MTGLFWRPVSPCVVMDAATGLHDYHAVIVGECRDLWREANAADLCEVSDLVGEAQCHLLTCWPRLSAKALNLKACVRQEVRRRIRRTLKQLRRKTAIPMDFSAGDAA